MYRIIKVGKDLRGHLVQLSNCAFTNRRTLAIYTCCIYNIRSYCVKSRAGFSCSNDCLNHKHVRYSRVFWQAQAGQI